METFQHVSHGPVKLGGVRSPHLFKLLPFTNYAKISNIAYPPAVSWWRNIAYQMLGNDVVGDCVIAWMLHQIMQYAAVSHAGSPVSFSTDQALETYSAITDYNPSDPNTDQGTDPIAAMQYWAAYGLFGHTITGPGVSIDVSNIDAIKSALYLFTGIGISLAVPRYVFDVPAEGSWSEKPGLDTSIAGLHQVLGCGFGSQGVRFVSWGVTYTMDWPTWSKYVNGAQAVVSLDAIKQSGVSPTGLDLNGLIGDLQSL